MVSLCVCPKKTNSLNKVLSVLALSIWHHVGHFSDVGLGAAGGGVSGGLLLYFGWGNPSIVLNFFICINPLKTLWPQQSEPPPPIPSFFLYSHLLLLTGHHTICVGWKGWCLRNGVGGGGAKGVADHGKNTIPGLSIALVPAHFTGAPASVCATCRWPLWPALSF